MPATIWKKDVYFGKREEDGMDFYLKAPHWVVSTKRDFWSFGQLSNKEDTNVWLFDIGMSPMSMYEYFLQNFDLTPKIRSVVCDFSHLMWDSISLAKAAAIYNKRGAYINDRHKEILSNTAEADHINYFVLPELFNQMYGLIKPNPTVRDKINDLAAVLALHNGYERQQGYDFTRATTSNSKMMFEGACKVWKELYGTEPDLEAEWKQQKTNHNACNNLD